MHSAVIISVLTVVNGERNGESISVLDPQIQLLLRDRWVLEGHGNFLMLSVAGLYNNESKL